MSRTIKPSLPLIVSLAGLSQLSETLCSPSLPAIQGAFHLSSSVAEWTLSLYIAGFSVGVLLWGTFSDRVGRRPCVLLGLFLFFLGSVSCYMATSPILFFFGRFIQGFGSSIGSVLGQAMTRDVFHGSELTKVFGYVGSSLSIFPALGPIIGQSITTYGGWRSGFISIACFSLCILCWATCALPETHRKQSSSSHSLLQIGIMLFRDRYVRCVGILVGLSNGLGFTYFSKGSLYVTQTLQCSKLSYSMSFLCIASAACLGGIYSFRTRNSQSDITIIRKSVFILLGFSILGCSNALLSWAGILPLNYLFYSIVGVQSGMACAICAMCNRALSSALIKYKWCTGVASSFFGSFYYSVLSVTLIVVGGVQFNSVFDMPFLSFLLSAVIAYTYWSFSKIYEQKN